jgi:hypothetical protein
MAIVSYAKSISELAAEGAKIAKQKGLLKKCGKMCDTCAFRWNQDHTLAYFLAADSAAHALMSDGNFNCHTYDFKDANKPCAGFQLSKLVDQK